MKESAMLITLVVFSFIAFGVAACGNSAQAKDDDSMNAMSHDDHSDYAGHDMEAAKDKASVKNGFDGMPAEGTKALCPVTGDEFEVNSGTAFSEYKGKTYVFCCPGCKPSFEENPEKYIN